MILYISIVYYSDHRNIICSIGESSREHSRGFQLIRRIQNESRGICFAFIFTDVRRTLSLCWKSQFQTPKTLLQALTFLKTIFLDTVFLLIKPPNPNSSSTFANTSMDLVSYPDSRMERDFILITLNLSGYYLKGFAFCEYSTL